MIKNTLNIFEAAYYLTNPDSSLREVKSLEDGNINYILFCDDETLKVMEAEFKNELVKVYLHSYLWKYKDLVTISNKIKASLEKEDQ